MKKKGLTEVVELPSVFSGEARYYCDNGNCDVRQIRVRLKRYEDRDVPLIAVCPMCRGPLLFDGLIPLRELIRKEDREARISVNVQRYQRDTGDMAVPASVLCDDSLP